MLKKFNEFGKVNEREDGYKHFHFTGGDKSPYKRMHINSTAEAQKYTFKLINVLPDDNFNFGLKCILYCVEKNAYVIYGAVSWVISEADKMGCNVINKEEVEKINKEYIHDLVNLSLKNRKAFDKKWYYGSLVKESYDEQLPEVMDISSELNELRKIQNKIDTTSPYSENWIALIDDKDEIENRIKNKLTPIMLKYCERGDFEGAKKFVGNSYEDLMTPGKVLLFRSILTAQKQNENK